MLNFNSNSIDSSLIHYWDFGDSTFDSSVNPTHIYTAPTVSTSMEDFYTVIHAVSDSLGCTDTFTIDVYVIPPIVPTIIDTSSACPKILSTDYPDLDYLDFQWSIDGIPDTVNGTDATYQTTVPGNYTVQIIAVEHCEGTSLPVFIDPYKGCCINDTAAFVVIENLSASDVILMSGSDTVQGSQIVLIKGIFTVDDDFTILNSPFVYLDTDALVLIEGAKLTIENSRLQAACDSMWTGIALVGNESNEIHIKRSLIEEAYVGVFAKDDAKVTVEDSSVFDRNWQHLYFQDYTNAAIKVLIRQSKFLCTDTLLPLLDSTITQTCIQTLNVNNITIGDDADADFGNLFHAYSDWGILFRDSRATVVNSTITNEFTPQNYLSDDVGIRAQTTNTTSSLTVGGLSANAHCTIEHTKMGIVSDSFELSIINNTFFDMDTGILAEESLSKIEISNNYFKTARRFSVFLRDNPNADTIQINDNLLEVGAKAHGILVHEFNSTGNALSEIRNNKIEGTFRGITISMRDSVIIDNNHISYPKAYTGSSPVVYGIGCTNTHGAVVINNVVTDTIPGTNPRTGIGFLAGSNATVCNNYVTHVEDGFAFINNFMDAIFELNVMDSCENGLILVDTVTLLGVQGSDSLPSDNQWVNNNTFATRTILSIGDSSQMYVRNLPDYYPTNNAGFFAIQFDTATGLDVATCGDSLHFSKRSLNNRWDWLLGINPHGLNSNTTSGWLIENALADYINFHPELDTLNPGLGVLIRHLKNSTAWKFSKIQVLLDQPYHTGTGGSIINTSIARATHLNNRIRVNLDIEQYHKDVNSIYLSTWALGKDELSSQQIQKLQEIAELCYSEAGTAIFKARVMLSSVDTTDYWMHCYDFESSLPKEIVEDNSIENSKDKLYLYPNPAENYLAVEYRLLETEIGKITIKTPLGSIVTEIEIQGGSNKTIIPLDRISNGIYSCIFDVNGKSVATKNFVVLK